MDTVTESNMAIALAVSWVGGGAHTVWVENFEAINFCCFRGVSLDPRIFTLTWQFSYLVMALHFKPATLPQ
jgi:hypothetical protein